MDERDNSRAPEFRGDRHGCAVDWGMSTGSRGILFALFAAASSCDKADTGAPSCPIGADGCACTAGGGCDPDLSCAASICVKPDVAKLIPFSPPRAATGEESIATIMLVECTRDGAIVVDGQTVEDAQFDAHVRAKQGEHRDLAAVLRCDADVPTGRLLALLDRMRSNGIVRYALAMGGKGPIAQPLPEAPPPMMPPPPEPERR
jgi:biopolymer transport protein ExbD